MRVFRIASFLLGTVVFATWLAMGILAPALMGIGLGWNVGMLFGEISLLAAQRQSRPKQAHSGIFLPPNRYR
jgi:hypothetical protein